MRIEVGLLHFLIADTRAAPFTRQKKVHSIPSKRNSINCNIVLLDASDCQCMSICVADEYEWKRRTWLWYTSPAAFDWRSRLWVIHLLVFHSRITAAGDRDSVSIDSSAISFWATILCLVIVAHLSPHRCILVLLCDNRSTSSMWFRREPSEVTNLFLNFFGFPTALRLQQKENFKFECWTRRPMPNCCELFHWTRNQF